MLSTVQSLAVIGLLIAASALASYAYERRVRRAQQAQQARETTDAAVSARVVMKRGMGLFLMLVALPKLLNLQSFSVAFSRYDLLARAAPAYAYVYPFLEMALGVAWWRNAAETGRRLAATYVSTFALMGISLAGVLYALWHSHGPLECGCLGTVVHMPLSLVTVLETGGMLLMASYLLWSGR